jgi:hypothetical protein
MTMDLQPHEAKLIELIRALPSDVAKEVEDFASFKAARTGTWSYDDPGSIARAIERMANDQEVMREVQAIERDFAPAINDGLENL